MIDTIGFILVGIIIRTIFWLEKKSREEKQKEEETPIGVKLFINNFKK